MENERELEQAFSEAKIGTLVDPHKSATLIIRVQNEKNNEITICGAGIDKHLTIRVSDMVVKAMRLRDMQNYEYPQGIDMMFVTEDMQLFCIPRLVFREEK